MESVTLASTGQQVKLGRRPPQMVEDYPRFKRITTEAGTKIVLKLEAYHEPERATAVLPDSIDHLTKAQASIKQMLGNDQQGDCVIASTGHGVGVWSGNDSGTPILSSDSEALSEYHTICGGGDNGCVITDVLDTMKSRGVQVGGKFHKIDDYVSIDPKNYDLLKTVLILLGSFRIGFNVPSEYMNTPDGGTWDNLSRFQSVGGHDVRAFDYGPQGIRIATWAGTRWFTKAALANQNIVDECYVELSPDWYGIDGLAPGGFDVATLKADLAIIKAGGTPDIGPVHSCPAGQHWDAAQGKCVPDTPPPTCPPGTHWDVSKQQCVSDAPPLPTSITFTIPAVQCVQNGFRSYYVPAQTLTVPINASGTGNTLTIPPWLLRLLKLACSGVIVLPPPYSIFVGLLCGLLPPAAELDAMVNSGEGLTLTIPPWLIQILTLACSFAPNLPAPYGPIAQILCGIIPHQAKGGCGCQP